MTERPATSVDTLNDTRLAEARVAEARARLNDTIATLQARLAPKALAQGAVQGVVDKGQEIAREGVETARKYPLPLAGAAAAIGLFLFRRPLARLFRHDTSDATPALPASLTPTATRAAKRNAA